MINLPFTFLVGVLMFEIGIAFGNDTKSCLENQGLALSVVDVLIDMECATNEGKYYYQVISGFFYVYCK